MTKPDETAGETGRESDVSKLSEINPMVNVTSPSVDDRKTTQLEEELFHTQVL